MTIKKDIKAYLKSVVLDLYQDIEGLNLENIDPDVDFAVNEKFGDLSTNIALQLHSQLKALSANTPQETNTPREIAVQISKQILIQLHRDTVKQLSRYIKQVTVAGPGFINFTLSDQFLLSQLDLVNEKKQDFGRKLTNGKKQGTSDQKKGRKGSQLKKSSAHQSPSKAGPNDQGERLRIVVEYTDPNPFKEFHIGHLYSNVVGQSVSNLLESQGHHVWRADFFGDVGMHVAKALWGILGLLQAEHPAFNQKELVDRFEAMQELALEKRVEFMGKAYAKGATEFKDGGDQSKAEIKALNFLAFRAAQEVVLPTFTEKPQVNYDQYIQDSGFDYENIKRLYSIGRSWSMEYFERIYYRLGTKFDGYYPESRTGEFGYGMVLDGLDRGIFEKGENDAIIFPGEKNGLHNRVFINALGLPTYEAKDFGNAVAKKKDFDYDQSVVVTGNEIDEYFKVVIAALTAYKPELGKSTVHISHGMVKLPEGKMSSRTGKILRGEWLLDEAKKRVVEIMKQDAAETEISEQFSNESLEHTAEQVAQAAVRYALLKGDVGKDVIFDFDSSISFQGSSGPYIQYTYARAISVLKKGKVSRGINELMSQESTNESETHNPSTHPPINSSTHQPINFLSQSQVILKDIDWNQLHIDLNQEERAVLNWLWRFSDAVERAATDYAPHYVATYIYELAQRFNSFYNKHSILGESQRSDLNKDDLSSSQPINSSTVLLRLALTAATAQVLKNGLFLLGIQAPEKM